MLLSQVVIHYEFLYLMMDLVDLQLSNILSQLQAIW